MTAEPAGDGLPGMGPVPYRILTVHQPWAGAMFGARGPVPGDPGPGTPGRPGWAVRKDIENRPQSSSWTGRLWIHAGKTVQLPPPMATPEFLDGLRARQADWKITEDAAEWVWPTGWDGDPATLPIRLILGYVTMSACTAKWNPSPWAVKGQFHYWLSSPVPLEKPVPLRRGRLGLWSPKTETDEADRAVDAVLRAVA